MPIYKRGEAFLVCVGSGKGRFRKSYKTQAEAEKAEKRELLIREGVIDRPEGVKVGTKIPTKGHTMSQAFDLAEKDVWSQNKGDTSVRVARRVLSSMGGDTPVKDVNTSLIRELVEEWEDAGNTGGTVNAKLSAISVMLKCAADEGWIEGLPRIKRRSPGAHRLRWMDFNEELKALNLCDKLGLLALKDYIQVAIDTGFRKMELMDFEVKEYHHGMLHLHPGDTKTSKPRSIPATARVAEIIEKRKHNSRLFDDLTPCKLRDQWAVIRESMGMTEDPQFVVHMLRHTCASRLAMQDKSAKFIQDWMGHSSPLTTARYMHLAPGKLIEGAEALDQYRKGAAPMLKVV
jgi:integrase